jgi:hypothetical protein
MSDDDFLPASLPTVQLPAHGPVNIVEYNDKSIAVFGDTKPIKEALKSLGGRFHTALSSHTDGGQSGWLLDRGKRPELEGLLGGAGNVDTSAKGLGDNVSASQVLAGTGGGVASAHPVAAQVAVAAESLHMGLPGSPSPNR